MGSLPREFGLFIKSVVWQWWALMSCALWTFVAIWGEKYGKTNDWYVRASFWVGLFLLCVAVLLAWHRQYKEVQQAQERIKKLTTRRLEIVGVAAPQQNRYDDGQYGVGYHIEVANVGETTTAEHVEVKLMRIEPATHAIHGLPLRTTPHGHSNRLRLKSE